MNNPSKAIQNTTNLQQHVLKSRKIAKSKIIAEQQKEKQHYNKIIKKSTNTQNIPL